MRFTRLLLSQPPLLRVHPSATKGLAVRQHTAAFSLKAASIIGTGVRFPSKLLGSTSPTLSFVRRVSSHAPPQTAVPDRKARVLVVGQAALVPGKLKDGEPARDWFIDPRSEAHTLALATGNLIPELEVQIIAPTSKAGFGTTQLPVFTDGLDEDPQLCGGVFYYLTDSGELFKESDYHWDERDDRIKVHYTQDTPTGALKHKRLTWPSNEKFSTAIVVDDSLDVRDLTEVLSFLSKRKLEPALGRALEAPVHSIFAPTEYNEHKRVVHALDELLVSMDKLVDHGCRQYWPRRSVLPYLADWSDVGTDFCALNEEQLKEMWLYALNRRGLLLRSPSSDRGITYHWFTTVDYTLFIAAMDMAPMLGRKGLFVKLGKDGVLLVRPKCREEGNEQVDQAPQDDYNVTLIPALPTLSSYLIDAVQHGPSFAGAIAAMCARKDPATWDDADWKGIVELAYEAAQAELDRIQDVPYGRHRGL